MNFYDFLSMQSSFKVIEELNRYLESEVKRTEDDIPGEPEDKALFNDGYNTAMSNAELFLDRLLRKLYRGEYEPKINAP